MIKNKNGEEYRISKPNPLMKYQDLWSIYTLHNFFWSETIEKNKKQTSKILEEKILEEDVEGALEEKVLEEKILEEDVLEKILEEETIKCYYLKAETTSFLDNLYGDKKTKIKYNQRKIININLDSYNDLFLYFVCEEKLEKNSIIFPRNKDKRWWKINKVKEEEKGYSYECIPSDFTPSFS